MMRHCVSQEAWVKRWRGPAGGGGCHYGGRDAPLRDGEPRARCQDPGVGRCGGGGDNPELIHELIVTALKLARDRAQRGDLKLLNAALKEMRYSMLVFSGTRMSRRPCSGRRGSRR